MDIGGSSRAGKWLVVGRDPSQRWRLADDTNLDYIEAQIKAAMRSGDTLTVEVGCVEGSQKHRLVLNGHALPYVLLIEDGEVG
ncbi:MAG TPA: hypothetical protein VN636_19980 [Acidimicrobiia bacterium]|nr:hypothetical protein [Acidimicrobiia bacterium]